MKVKGENVKRSSFNSFAFFPLYLFRNTSLFKDVKGGKEELEERLYNREACPYAILTTSSFLTRTQYRRVRRLAEMFLKNLITFYLYMLGSRDGNRKVRESLYSNVARMPSPTDCCMQRNGRVHPNPHKLCE